MSAKLGAVCPEEIVLFLDRSNDRAVFTVQASGRGYDGSVQLGGQSPVPQAFWERIRHFAEKKVPIACGGGASWAAREIGERDRTIAGVAAEGSALFRMLLPNADDRTRLRDLLKPIADEYPRIRAVNSAALIPWEALCVREPEEGGAYSDFLGWSHVIVRETHLPTQTSETGREVIRAMNAIEDDGLPQVRTGRSAEARDRFGAAIDHEVLPPLTKPQDIELFHDFMFDIERRPGVIHFDCHVELGEGLAVSHMVATAAFPITYAQFQHPPLDLGFSPLVFFNCCHGGTVSPGEGPSYASRFREAGAQTVIAAEAAVGDAFAADFAETFYQTAGDWDDVGAALRHTRRQFLLHDRNPLALFYGLYGDVSNRLALPPGEAPEPDSPLARRLSMVVGA
jgi:hypothetical protein